MVENKAEETCVIIAGNDQTAAVLEMINKIIVITTVLSDLFLVLIWVTLGFILFNIGDIGCFEDVIGFVLALTLLPLRVKHIFNI